MSEHKNPLGQATVYSEHYAPELLFPIAREASRKLLGIDQRLPFYGCDIWTAYELSWLNHKGKPVVALGEFVIPCHSPFIIESKSFKLYLNSFNQTRFDSIDQVSEVLVHDLSRVAGDSVRVNLSSLSESSLQSIHSIEGIGLDELDIDITQYHPDAALLTCNSSHSTGDNIVSEILYSHLLKTNCPVTGQPDWASIVISYKGNKINPEQLLAYIISFRNHQDFHEHCVERIFCDIQEYCKPTSLTVYARYTRRGGLDINPYRSSDEQLVLSGARLVRQ